MKFFSLVYLSLAFLCVVYLVFPYIHVTHAYREHSITAEVSDVLFAPDDDLRAKLLELIDAEHSHIYAALYYVSDQAVVDALIRAQRRGVCVQVVTDSSNLDTRYAKFLRMRGTGIGLYIYPGKREKVCRAIMHHKFIVCTANGDGLEAIVATGSCNFTTSGLKKNHENLVVLRSSAIAKKYTKHFRLLLDRCDVL